MRAWVVAGFPLIFLGFISMEWRQMKVERNGNAMSFLGSVDVDNPNFLTKELIAVIHVYLQFWFYQLA